MWIMPLVGEPPCQCFSPGGIQTTSPALISRIGPPLLWTRPTPEITYSVWPSGCVCQFVRAPGSKDTRFEAIRAGAAVAMIGSCQTVPVKYSFGARRVGREPAKWISIVSSLVTDALPLPSPLFLRSHVARLGLGIHGIEARQYRAGVHLLDDPGFHPLLFCAFGQNEIEKRLRDHHGAVLIGDDDVVRKHRNAAAADGFAPTDEGQPGDRGRRREAVAPHRQTGAEQDRKST